MAKGGPSYLAASSMSFLFLQWKILDLSVRNIVGCTPSGLVPSGAVGARALRSSASCGEDSGLDRFSCYCYMLIQIL
jgi:hypothetical protein